MEAVRQYLLSITAAAIICSIVNRIIGKNGTYGAIVKLISGLFLVITVISPFTNLQITDLTAYMAGLSVDADSAVLDGQQTAKDAVSEIIKAEAEAYILDKAASLELCVEAEVMVSDTDIPQPCAVTLKGSASPYARQRLQQLIANDLGIPEENQAWK